MFWRELIIQSRVVGALILREGLTLHGRHGLGFLWVVAEPLMFATPVLIMWSMIRTPYEHGVQVMGIAWSGYLPILLFRHLGGRILLFIRANAGLLYHRRVTILDLFLARAALEIASNLITLFLVFCIFYLAGELDPPVNMPMFFFGYFMMIWWCVAVALIMGAISERIEWIDKVWMPYSYMYLVFSGFMYLADWRPPPIRNLALYQPSLQAYEMIRAGLFGTAIRTYYDPAYTATFLAAMTCLGLWLMREGRKYVVVE